jgi:bifunctional UDP-N-acetylglucosamine pyrophosphorylase / glucosamine-1-phosphate N-acetyltransferase
MPVSNDVAAIVLAAGKGTRFRSDRAKVLHRAAGRTLVGHVLEALRPLGLAQVIVVVGYQADEVRAEVESLEIPGLTTVVQADQRGTGHAVQQAVPALADGIDRVMVLAGDTPLITTAWLEQLLTDGMQGAGAMLTAQLVDPSGYGRVLRDREGSVEGIVEHKDASPAQLMVREINAGMYVVERSRLLGALAQLDDDNEQGEIYLTDVVRILADGEQPFAGTEAPVEVIAGVNDRAQLAEAAAVLRRDHLLHLMSEVGVSVLDPSATYVDVDVEVGRDTVLLPGTILERGTRVGERSVIGPNTHLTHVEVGDDAVVHSTRGIDAVVGDAANVGPFAHLRVGTRLGDATKVGAYVETKNTTLGDGSKIPHLAYVGDATVGTGVNIACGVITVNYDGQTKSTTTIEDGAFIGCDTMLIAPVTIGAEAYTAAGSTITDDVPAGALGIARSRQTTKEGWAARRQQTRRED